jgi:hypothetical protein
MLQSIVAEEIVMLWSIRQFLWIQNREESLKEMTKQTDACDFGTLLSFVDQWWFFAAHNYSLLRMTFEIQRAFSTYTHNQCNQGYQHWTGFHELKIRDSSSN